MLLTRAEISTVYAGGVDAVIGLIEQLQAVAIAQQEQIAVLSARVKELGNRSEGARRYAATGSGQIRGGCCAWGKRDGGGAAVVRAAQASVR